MRKIAPFLLLGLLATSCVSKKEFSAVSDELNRSLATQSIQTKQIDSLRRHVSQLQYDSAAAQASIRKFIEDSISQSKNLHQANIEIEELKKNNNDLMNKDRKSVV